MDRRTEQKKALFFFFRVEMRRRRPPFPGIVPVSGSSFLKIENKDVSFSFSPFPQGREERRGAGHFLLSSACPDL